MVLPVYEAIPQVQLLDKVVVPVPQLQFLFKVVNIPVGTQRQVLSWSHYSESH